MKKFIFLIMLSILLVFSGNGLAYTIDDDTLVGKGRNWDGLFTQYLWVDDIPTDGEFEIYGIDVFYDAIENTATLKIYTEFDGYYSYLNFEAVFGDIFFDVDSGYTYGIDFQTGIIYSGLSNDNVNTSYEMLEAPGIYPNLYYGEVWYNGQSPYVDIVTSLATDTGYVATINDSYWGDLGYYEVIFDLDVLGGGIPDGTLDIFWAVATCANDIVQGSAAVPEPATMFLLGSGLIGMAGIVRIKSKK